MSTRQEIRTDSAGAKCDHASKVAGPATSERSRAKYRRLRAMVYRYFFSRFPCRQIANAICLWRNHGKSNRALEIGPGPERIERLETLSITAGRHVDYVVDVCKRLPFRDSTFELIYASHVLEHVPWYQAVDVLREWVRILQPDGVIEIWVPDGLKLCRALVEYEDTGKDESWRDGWYRFNGQKEVCKWAAGRIFSYGDGTGRAKSANWHRALFTPRYLAGLLAEVGLVDVCEMDRIEVRGNDHGWINLGMRGRKP